MKRHSLCLLLLATALASPACRGTHAAERGQVVYLPSSGEQTKTPDRTLSSTGKATLMVSPDVADIAVHLEVERVSSSRVAAKQISQMRARFLAKLRSQKLKNEQIVVSHIDIRPIYSPYVRGELARIIGYNASSNIKVELRDFDRIAAVLDDGVSAGATRVSTTFRSTKMTEHKREVYDMALKAARAKAEQMASALDIKELRVRSVQEGEQNGYGWGGWQTSHVANAYVNAAPTPSPSGIVADAKQLSLSISVVYEII